MATPAELRSQLLDALAARPELIYGPAGALLGALAGAGMARLGEKRGRGQRMLWGGALGAEAGALLGAGLSRRLPALPRPEKPLPRLWDVQAPVRVAPGQLLAYSLTPEGDPKKSFANFLEKQEIRKQPPIRPEVPTVMVAGHGGGYPGEYWTGQSMSVPFDPSPEQKPGAIVDKLKKALSCEGVKSPWDLRWTSCNRMGGLAPETETALKEQGLAPERVQRTPAYSYGLIGAATPVFKGMSGKPVGLEDYVAAGRLYQNTGRAVGKTVPTPQGGWWNAEVQTGTQPAAELLDFARKWEEPQVAEAAATKEGLSPLATTLGYADKGQLAPRWKEMVKRFKDWFAGQKTPVRPEAKDEPYRPRPELPEVLSPEERAARQAADPEIKLPPGYGLAQEERASVANMLRSYPQESGYSRRAQMAQTLEALTWTKPDVALLTPSQQTLFNTVIDRYDELRKTKAPEEALDILRHEAPEVVPLIEKAIAAGFIIARKSPNPAEKTAYEGEDQMTPQAFVDGYKQAAGNDQAFVDGYLSKTAARHSPPSMVGESAEPPVGPQGGTLMAKAPDKTERALFNAGRPEPRPMAPAQGMAGPGTNIPGLGAGHSALGSGIADWMKGKLRKMSTPDMPARNFGGKLPPHGALPAGKQAPMLAKR